MIVYSKVYWGIPLLTRAFGSALPRALPAACTSAVIAALLALFAPEVVSAWVHPYALVPLATLVSFAVVFRGNYAHARYWEGRSTVQAMRARFQDAAIQTEAFICLCAHLVETVARMGQALRRDPALSNLQPYSDLEVAPSADLALEANPPPSIHLPRHVQLQDLFVLRGSPQAIADVNAAQPLHVIGGLSEQEHQALGCGAGSRSPAPIQASAGGGQAYSTAQHHSTRGGLSGKTRFLRSLNVSCCAWHLPYMERPFLVMAWLHQLLWERIDAGGVPMPDPIRTRAFQDLSDGHSSFAQALKVAETPFPFPWAQLLFASLILMTVFVPLLLVAYTKPALAIVLSALTTGTFWAMNEVSRDLEDPFNYVPNELPLTLYQHNFNRVLLSTAGQLGLRPPATADSHRYISHASQPSQTWGPHVVGGAEALDAISMRSGDVQVSTATSNKV